MGEVLTLYMTVEVTIDMHVRLAKNLHTTVHKTSGAQNCKK